MEEIENVASRIAILKNGECVAFGSCQHLKSRFGGGYALSVFFDEPKLRDANVSLDVAKTAADQKIRQALQNTQVDVVESSGPTRVYTLENPPALSAVFNALASVRQELNIDSYSVAQTSSLETIFVRFAGERAGTDEN